MALRTALLVLFIWCLWSIHHGAEGKSTPSEKQNNTPVKTIKTTNGHVYNCIEFHKQPAFYHPSLKNHTVHFDEIKQYVEKHSNKKNGTNLKSMWLNGEGCPNGTVPIREVANNKFINNKFPNSGVSDIKVGFQDRPNPGAHYAIIRTKEPGRRYYGAGMGVSLYNPQVEGSQYSAARLKLANGPDSIEVGWMVNLNLYGDLLSHLYVFTNGGNSHCYNTHCLGIISVREDFPVDAVLMPTSTRGSSGEQYATYLFIYKDQMNGNWFLRVNDNIIGFWPPQRFEFLEEGASYVDWGGEVFSPPNLPNPPMGAGNSRLFKSQEQDAYGFNMEIINEDHKVVDASNTEKYSNLDVYHVEDGGFDTLLGNIFYFGGSGSNPDKDGKGGKLPPFYDYPH
ncbi:uncharacterized protein LOC130014446 [Mercurialis annua]|uniref:uncharacterized protein LOC130014446 n=1 Tax=Mercurialis annua TaxID=3986 RepID=UPI00215F4F14|nr:uncharacterized protein LOC130014446 [Mercurialis annua]